MKSEKRKVESVFSERIFSESLFSESLFSESVFSESVFSECVFSKSVFILSVFLRNVLDLRVFLALRVYCSPIHLSVSPYHSLTHLLAVFI